MSDAKQTLLYTLHHQAGLVLQLSQRLLTGVVVLGALFFMLTLGCLRFFRDPGQVLHVQAFMFNYAELTTEVSSVSRASQGASNSLQATEGGRRANLKKTSPSDPNWDGLMAGAAMGLTLGRNIPVFGVLGGPVVGAIIGYELDSRI